jgi:aspartyl-tRNA(Asn)/glutamyl-tRNA(Gln) amidotransferase subunit B
MKKIHALVRYLEICDGNMQEGSFRCDANVSVRRVGQHKFGTRAEIKNINSFRFVERAILHEIERQIDVLEGGGSVVQETRLYDPDKDETRSMRSKEEAMDYRYFPDPDLLPLEIDAAFIEGVRATLPELPDQKKARFVSQYAIPEYDAGVLTATREMGDYYEKVAEVSKSPKLASNWVMGDLSGLLNKNNLDITQSPITPQMLGTMIARITDNTISGKIAKTVFEAMWNGEGDPDAIIKAKGLVQVTDTGAIEKIIEDVMAKNPEQLAQYRSGKDKLFGFFVGQVMKASGGKANPAQLNELLQKKLKA